MINVSRQSAGTVFLVLLVPTLLMLLDWRFVGIAWIVLLGWYLLIRRTLAESKGYLRNPIYIACAIVSLTCVPSFAILSLIIGDSSFRPIAENNEQHIAPVITLAMLFVVYSVWTGAKSLVISEERNASDRALRWERTVKTFLAMYFWPFGVWSVQKRLRAVAE